MAEYVHTVRHSHLYVGIPNTTPMPPHWDSRGKKQQNYPATHPRAPRVDGAPTGPPDPRRHANFTLPAEGEIQ